MPNLDAYKLAIPLLQSLKHGLVVAQEAAAIDKVIDLVKDKIREEETNASIS